MKFKDLNIGDKFTFSDNRDNQHIWMKISARCYKPDTNPFSDDREERDEHEFWVNRHNQVGSINEEIIPFLPNKFPSVSY